MGTKAPSRGLALSILQRMGETGQPPERGSLHVNVGTEETLDLLRTEYLEPIRETGRNSSFKLVQAPFGGGKTHFLHTLREIGWRERFATSLVGISPQECPFDDSVSIYRAVARNLELPPSAEEEEPEPGIDVVLRTLVQQRAEQYGEKEVREWLRNELAHSRVDSRAVRRAAELYMLAVLDLDDEIEDVTGAFLLGEDVHKNDLYPLRIREQLEGKTAFAFLRSLVQLLRAMEIPGLILLFDELDRVMSLSVKRRKAIGDNLRQMIDHCGQATLPALLWVYAVPPEFMTTIVPEYPALEQRLRGASDFSRRSPLEPVIDLDHLPLEPEELFRRIGTRLLELFEVAHGVTFDRDLQAHNLALLARAMAEEALESGSRRTFVKKAIHVLHEQRLEEKRLDRGDLGSFGGGGGFELEGETEVD